MVQAQEGASTLLREAQSQANEIQAQSEGASAERVAEAELMVANATQEARDAVERIRYDALAEAEAVIARAKDEGRALLEQVQEARKRVMADLAGRRRALSIQIEQLRAARDEMAASVQGVRGSIDAILAQLERSDDDARTAGLAAADQARLHLPKDLPEEETVPSVEAGEDPAQGGVTPSVDELFARIRAGTDAARQDDEATADGEAVYDGDYEAAEAEAAAAEAEAVEGEAEEEAEEPPEGPDQALITRRDELLSPVSAQLSRHIKRALGDDQNRLLDVLRSTPNVGGEALLGPEDLHLSMFTSAAQGHLADAFAAGTVFGGRDGRGDPSGPDRRSGCCRPFPHGGDHAAPAHRRRDRRRRGSGREGGGGVPGVAGRADRTAGRRLRRAGVLGRRRRGQFVGRAAALGAHLPERLLGLRRQRTGGSRRRRRLLSDRTRLPSSPFGLSLHGGARSRPRPNPHGGGR